MALKNTQPLNPTVQKIFSIIISIAIAVSGYFLNSTFNTMQDMENRIYTLEIDSAKTSGSRFTSSDFVDAKKVIDNQILAADKRIIILEEQNKAIRDLLNEIKLDLKELKSR